MKKKWNRFRIRMIDWFKDVASLIKENKKIALIVIAFVVVIIVAVVITSILGGKSKEVTTVLATEDSATVEDYAIPEDPLEVDAYPEINDFMKKYYNAAASGDIAAISSMRTGLDDKETIVIQKKSEYINSYPVITCYTKKGPVEDSYLAYVYYEVKLEGYEESIPGLNAWYISKDASGNYFINEDPQDEKVAEYCKIISVQDDVQDLSNTVNVKFNDVMASNDDLASYMDDLTVQMKVEVGEELAKAEAESAAEAQTETNDDNIAVTSADGESKVKATTVVNVRASDSESADKVGKAQEGQIFNLLEEKVNGWSKIDFEGKEAFIKTEFLEKVGATSEGSSEDNAAKDKISDEEAAAASPSSGTATVKETINVRKSASTSSDKLGVCYAGEKLEVVTKQGDGWTKVKYNGKTGFVKSEFLE